MRILSGIQPTGIPHLGNYLGALNHWVHLQQSHQPSLFMIADLHSLTVPQDPKVLSAHIFSITSALLAIGLCPDKNILFRQSQISQHLELAWILMCKTPVQSLYRLHHWKSKTESEQEESDSRNVGLLSYPVLQTADILLYKATHVPIGEDNAPHLNLSADLAQKFNSIYKQRIFPIPKTILGTQPYMLM
jgi:tryptophanyl-tRNA synthetase